MRYICRECGNEIDAGSDFCHYCGALKSNAIAIDDQGNPAGEEGKVCPVCGAVCPDGVKFCGKCGASLPTETPQPFVPHRLTARDYIALAAGLIPGVVNIFGLGHLVMKKWSRGLMYLAISAVIIYIRWFTPDLSGFMFVVVEMIGFGVYIIQSLEVFALIMRPGPKQGKKEGDQ